MDARIAAEMVALSSRVPGWVTAVDVTEGDAATRVRVLIRIDDRKSRLKVQELDAQLAGIARQRGEIEARITLIDRQSPAGGQWRLRPPPCPGRGAAGSRLDGKRAGRALGAARCTPQGPVGSDSHGVGDGVAAGTKLPSPVERMAVRCWPRLRPLVRSLQCSNVSSMSSTRRRIGSGRNGCRRPRHLEDRTLTMPFDGMVDRVFVDVDEYVTSGQRLLMVHEPGRVRIEANVKETDIRFFRPGKTVTITVDALSGRRFEGTVPRVGQAATSEFALLSNPNSNPRVTSPRSPRASQCVSPSRSWRNGRRPRLPQVDALVRVAYNPNITSTWFSNLLEMLNMSTMLSMLLTAAAMVREKEQSNLEQLLVSPSRPVELFLAKILCRSGHGARAVVPGAGGIVEGVIPYTPLRGSLALSAPAVTRERAIREGIQIGEDVFLDYLRRYH